ncbi:b16.1 [Ichnoviriform fugitivi]|uniref:B16.1 n=1 Tax=Ichnoviriform fugitivi TaxID=265522 RepID=A2Q0F3_9VIRU|nr:b16.1 [Ichnoviriform fugitivi]BAF45668.1 b16.1 [Ichnoviriform fugitivi]
MDTYQSTLCFVMLVITRVLIVIIHVLTTTTAERIINMPKQNSYLSLWDFQDFTSHNCLNFYGICLQVNTYHKKCYQCTNMHSCTQHNMLRITDIDVHISGLHNMYVSGLLHWHISSLQDLSQRPLQQRSASISTERKNA